MTGERKLRVVGLLVVLLWLFSGGSAAAVGQSVKDLPMPASYVNDFAHVLSAEATGQMEAECLALHNQVKAEVTVVTLQTLPDDADPVAFTSQLEEKWKLGKKGSDRGLIFLLVVKPPHERIETGYGLEAVLPDAKAGRILDDVVPAWHGGEYDKAAETGLQEIADTLAADAHVTLPPLAQAQYHVETVPTTTTIAPPNWLVGLLLFGLAGLLYFLYRIGWLFPLIYLLQMFGGIEGGGGGGGGGDGGGFGGSGGGESGGGGASRD